jgi:signal transduction histidine kinase
MILKLRKKITVLLTMLFILAYVCFAAVFAISYQNSNEAAAAHLLSNHLQIASQKDILSDDPLSSPASEDTGTESTQVNGEDAEIMILVKTENGLQTVGGMHGTEGAAAIGQKCLDTGKTNGKIGQVQFEIASINDQLVIAYMNTSSYDNEVMHVLWRIIGIGIVATAVWGCLAWAISKRMAEPLVIAKQKQNDFIASAGHELKTPVTVMKTSLSLMKQEGIENKYLDYAIAENERMHQLILELLDNAELSEKDQKQKKEIFCLSSLLTAAALPFDASAYEAGVQYKEEIEEDIQVRGYAGELTKMCEILIENAIRYTKKGDQVIVSLHKKGKTAVLSVNNQGQAIAEDDKEKIFKKFYRAAEQDHENECHYGLGLAIAQKIADQNDTVIQVNSNKGWNSFSVFFHIQ